MRTIGELWIDDAGEKVRVGVGDGAECLPADVSAVRAKVRHDANGTYRPLSGARGLPTGWSVAAGPGLTVEDVVEAVYPLAVTHRRQFDDGTLRVVGLEDVLKRQSGRYESAGALSAAGRARMRAVLCGEQCVRVPVWDGATPGEADIPCPEPCSVLVALAREAAAWEHDSPELRAIDSSVEFADFETPGNAIRETYLSRMREDATQ